MPFTTAPFRLSRPVSFLLALVGAFVVWLLLVFVAARWADSHQSADLSRETWIAIPPQNPAGIDALQQDLLANRCNPNIPTCATWEKLGSLDFTRLPGKPKIFFLFAPIDKTKIVEKATADLPQQQARWVFSIGDSNGSFQAWIGGAFLGKTGRFMPPHEKFFPFASAESWPITHDQLFSTPNPVNLIVKVEPAEKPYLYTRMSITRMGIFERAQFLKIETLKLLTLAIAIMISIALCVYHFLVWLKRRDVAYLGFVSVSFFFGVQALAMYNLLAYIGISFETIVRLRVAFLNANFVTYVAFCLFMNEPVSLVYEWFKYRNSKTVVPQFSKFGILKKSFSVFGEFLIYIVCPTLFVVLPMLELNLGMHLLMKVSTPLLLLTNYGTFFVMAAWFLRTSRTKHIGYAIPFAMGIAVAQSAATTSAISALGSPNFSIWSVGYAVPFTMLLFALSLGNLFTSTHRRMGRLKAQLEDILEGTKQLSTIREQFTAISTAIHFVVERLYAEKDTNAYFFPPGEDGQQSQSSVAEFEVFQVLAQGKIVTEPVLARFERAEQIVAALASKHDDVILTPAADLVIRIRAGQQSRGFLVIENYAADELTEDDSHFATALSSSLAIALDNIHFVQETRQKAHMEAELNAAKTVQKALLPASTEFPGLDFAPYYQPAAQTGGDWYGFWYDKTTNSIDLCIGDVTGHGVPAALLTGVVCGSVYTSEIVIEELSRIALLSPAERLLRIAEAANRVVQRTGGDEHFMTMFFINLNLDTGELTYLNAGHNHPIRTKSLEDAVTTKVLVLSGTRLGFKRETSFSVKTSQLEPGDKVFLYTDGLIENEGPDAKTMSLKSIQQLLARNRHLDNKSLLRLITDKHKEVVGEVAPADDVSMFLLSWHGNIPKEEIATWRQSQG